MAAVTAEVLEERLRFLETRRSQLIADANAYLGAIQEAQLWLKFLAQSEQPDSPQLVLDLPPPTPDSAGQTPPA